MTTNIWQGGKIRLRAMEPDDWKAFHAFDDDTEMARYGWHIPFPRSAEGSQAWARETALAKPDGDTFRFVIETLDGAIVGTLNTLDCNPRNGTFGYGVALSREHWRKGYASEAIRLVLAYYFHELRYQKVTVNVYDFNEASLKLHEKLGFQMEGRLRRMIFTNGAYHDEFVLGLTAEEFEAHHASRHS